MNWVQIHLALNHLPVIGFPLVLVLLLAGCWRRSREVTRLALWAIAMLSAAALAIKFTGDFAAGQSAQKFAPVQEFVTRHEQAGDQAVTGVFLLGLSAALALWLARRERPLRVWTLVLVLALGVVTVGLFVRSAHSGGLISHPELRE